MKEKRGRLDTYRHWAHSILDSLPGLSNAWLKKEKG